MRFKALLFLSLLVIGSCQMYYQDTYREFYVVESYLIAHAPLPPVMLSKTISIDDQFTYNSSFNTSVDVEIRLLNADSTVAERYKYQGGGRFYPVDSTARVQANRLYQLLITFGNGDRVEAKTRVPGNFSTINKLKETYVYQDESQIEMTITPSFYPGRQSYYVITANAINPDFGRLTPFYSKLVNDDGNLMKSYYINSSGIINEKSLYVNSDNSLRVKLPWMIIAFYGENNLIINAIDDNLYDFMRSQQVQTEGLQYLNGQINNLNYNINGGIGIFGSMSSDTNFVFIKRPG